MIFGWNVMPLSYAIVPDGKGGNTALELKMFFYDYITWSEVLHNGREVRYKLVDAEFPIWRYPNPIVYWALRFDKFLYEEYRDFWLPSVMGILAVPIDPED
jgi:hypothetical protein|mmetsp:Transcript_15095/g.20496  ORF Transcript_15095/g.20496 Transcript_15095/m.20496 type:complete len:101 (-) Transcript_15095:374-676(-)